MKLFAEIHFLTKLTHKSIV